MEVVDFFQIYELRVMETKPDKAVSIIECDMNVRSLTTQEYSVLVTTENSTCFSGGFWCSFGLQRTWTATSAPRGTSCKDYALTQKFVLWTSWFSECLYRKEKITAVMLTWTWASGWVGVHVLYICQPRAEELMKTTFLLFNLGFHWLWQSFGRQNKRNWAQPSSSWPKWHQKVTKLWRIVQKFNILYFKIWIFYCNVLAMKRYIRNPVQTLYLTEEKNLWNVVFLSVGMCQEPHVQSIQSVQLL